MINEDRGHPIQMIAYVQVTEDLARALHLPRATKVRDSANAMLNRMHSKKDAPIYIDLSKAKLRTDS